MPGVSEVLGKNVIRITAAGTICVANDGTEDRSTRPELVIPVFVIDHRSCGAVIITPEYQILAIFVRSFERAHLPVRILLDGHIDDIVNHQVIHLILIPDVVAVVDHGHHMIVKLLRTDAGSIGSQPLALRQLIEQLRRSHQALISAGILLRSGGQGGGIIILVKAIAGDLVYTVVDHIMLQMGGRVVAE